MDKIKKKVEDKIAGKKVMVFSKPSCGYCAMAKECFRKLLKDQKLKRGDYEVWEISKEPDCAAIQTYLQKRTGAKTVPRVFINGVSVGGASDVQTLERQKKLAKMIYPDEELSVAMSTK